MPDPTITSKFHEKSPKQDFGEKFKTAIKNTNPKNVVKKGNELTKQLETKKDVAKSIKKSLNPKALNPKESPKESPRNEKNEENTEQTGSIDVSDAKTMNVNENSNNDKTGKD